MTAFAARLDFSTPHILRNEEEYDAAVAEIDALLDRDLAPRSVEHDRLELLMVLVRAYDEEHYSMGDVTTPQDILDFLLEQHGMNRGELADAFGGRSRVSEFFSGKRRLSISQILALQKFVDVPADLLIEPSTRS